jgi:hypothetical protein
MPFKDNIIWKLKLNLNVVMKKLPPFGILVLAAVSSSRSPKRLDTSLSSYRRVWHVFQCYQCDLDSLGYITRVKKVMN